MSTLVNNKIGLTNNQLKLIAMISMVFDHMGLLLFPGVVAFRILGRIAFPIYAFLIAEGCKHTKNKKKHLGLIAGMGIAYQIVYSVIFNDLYINILLTFSLAISLIYAIESFASNKNISNRILMMLVIGAIFFVGYLCPIIFEDYGFYMDYGIWGITLPALMYLCKGKWTRIVFLILFLAARACFVPSIHLYTLLSVPFIALYNGERGKAKMKYFFYIFYPLHIVLIYGIVVLIYIIRK